MEKKARTSKSRAFVVRKSPKAENHRLDALKISETSFQHLSVPYEDQAFKYFMDSCATGLEQPPFSSQAYHQHLSTNGVHPLVATTMTALGMAGLANLRMDPALKRQATQWYLKSIKMVNAAIADPEKARNDTTLVGVHLSSMFEATSNDKSLAGWSNHVEGAASLVKMRGKEQFSTLAGRRMYIQTIGLLTQNCIGQGIALPVFVQELNREAMKYLDLSDPRHAYFFLHIETSDFRAHVINQSELNLPQTIARALELDGVARSIFEEADAAWQYETVPSFGQVAGVFGDSYHVYPAHATAQTWNWVRHNRIYYHDIIRNCILIGLATSPPALVGSEYVDILGRSTRMLLQLQSDILASMPQFLNDTPRVVSTELPGIGHERPHGPQATTDTLSDATMSLEVKATWKTPPVKPAPNPETPTSFYAPKASKTFFDNFEAENVEFPDKIRSGVTATVQDRLPIVRVSGGYSTIWSLYIAGAMPTASSASQDFVFQCLTRISQELGINQANVLAHALKLKRQMDNNGEVAFALCPQYLPEWSAE